METFIALGFLKIEFKKPLMLSIRGFFFGQKKVGYEHRSQ